VAAFLVVAMKWLIETLQRYPEIGIFLSLAIGFAISVIDQVGITVSPGVEAVLFITVLFRLETVLARSSPENNRGQPSTSVIQ
jgi:hypothetical protein